MVRLSADAKLALKNARTIAEKQGKPSTGCLDVFEASILVSPEMQSSLKENNIDWENIVTDTPDSSSRSFLSKLFHPVSFTSEVKTLLLFVSNQTSVTELVTAKELALATLELQDPEVIEKLGSIGVTIDQCMIALQTP